MKLNTLPNLVIPSAEPQYLKQIEAY